MKKTNKTYGKTGAKVIPFWDVPIEKITGIF